MKTLASTINQALALFSFLFCISATQAQTIDSLCLIESNGVHQLYVGGDKPQTATIITRIEHEIIDDKINADLFFIHCPGYPAITPYDTLIVLQDIPNQTYEVTCRTINDINYDSTSCQPNYELSTIDSITFFLDITGISHITKKSSIYPNPFKNTLTINLPTAIEASFEILNLSGKMIENGKITNHKKIIDLGNIPEGTYLLKIHAPNIEPEFHKLIKLQ